MRVKKPNPVPGTIRAHVVLKGVAGDLTSGEPVSSKNVQKYFSDPSALEKVRKILESRGFMIRRVSPLGITVEASPEQFVKVFCGQLKEIKPPHAISRKRKGSRRAANGAMSFWTWSKSPVIPAELGEAVAAIVFPQPAKILE